MSLNNSYLINELVYDRQHEFLVQAAQERLAKVANGTRLSWWHRLMARVNERNVIQVVPATPMTAEAGQPAPS